MTDVIDRQIHKAPAKALDPASLRAAQAFVRMLGGRYAIRNVIAFGSRARGDHHAESDLDLAVILEGPPGDRFGVVRDFSATAFDAMMETGVLVQALPIWAEEFDTLASLANPALIETIKGEGIVL
jgi:UTP:GlnB (protein PII) uridylyltransferase